MSRPPLAEPQGGAPSKQAAGSVLAAARRPITRYRPAVIAGGLVVVLLLIGVGFLIAFGGGRKATRSPDQDAVAAPVSDAPPPIDERLPATYGELGPPPATIGGPAPGGAPADEGASLPGGPGSGPEAAPSAVQQQRLAEARAARSATPFFDGGGGAVQANARASAAAYADALPAPAPALSPAASAPIETKEGFIARASSPSPAYGPGLPTAPLSPFELKAGSTIAAALVTGLNSDLPGLVVAQVTQPVYDHATGRIVLVPQGARLIGKYDSQVGYGQDRLLLVWTRLIYPSGRSVDLGGMVGADAAGASGLSGKVDTHLPVLARAIGLSTLISIGGAAAQNSLARSSDTLVLQDGAGGLSAQASQTGGRLVERDLRRSPTLRISPGHRVLVMVDKDLILPPEAEGRR